MSIMLTSEILSAAADRLEAGKWIQGKLSDGYGGECLVQAIFSVRRDNPYVGHYTEDAAFEAVRAVTNERRCDMWNDAPGRTVGQVVGALRMAARIEAAKEAASP